MVGDECLVVLSLILDCRGDVCLESVLEKESKRVSKEGGQYIFQFLIKFLCLGSFLPFASFASAFSNLAER